MHRISLQNKLGQMVVHLWKDGVELFELRDHLDQVSLKNVYQLVVALQKLVFILKAVALVTEVFLVAVLTFLLGKVVELHVSFKLSLETVSVSLVAFFRGIYWDHSAPVKVLKIFIQTIKL